MPHQQKQDMIIENMSPQAIFLEMSNDARKLYDWARNLIGVELRHKFARSKIYPVYAIRKWHSPTTHTKWEIILICPEKKEANTPLIISYVKYDTEHGKGAFLYRDTTCGLSVLQYTPHFFSRYRERYIEPLEVNTSKFEDLIQYFFFHNTGLDIEVVTYDICYGACNHGSIFGRHLWDYFFQIKTYINNGLLSNAKRQRLDEYINGTRTPGEVNFVRDIPELQETPHKKLKYLPPLR